MTWWIWDAVFPLFSLSYLQQRWTKAATRGPWGASLALGPAAKPVLDVADFMDRSALACLSAGCCLSLLCTVEEEVHPLLNYVSVKTDTHIDKNRLFWIMCCVAIWCLGVGVRLFACFGVAFLLLAEFEVIDYLSHSLNQQGKSLWQTSSCSRFVFKAENLLQLFLNHLYQ